MLVNMRDMLLKARDGKYAVPHFNINNLEWTRFILEECNEHKSPVILGVSESAIKYMGGFNTVYNLVINLIKDLKINIPVCLHLDHGSYEACKKAIDASFLSVMFDGSTLPLEENISKTIEIIEYNKNVSVEAEIGQIGSDKKNHATVKDVKKFIQKTNVDAVAPALGSEHGLYLEEPIFDFETFKMISLEGTPLVLHGGSGINDEILKKLIDVGVCKINFNTELQIGWSKGLKQYIKDNSNIYDPRKIIKSGEKLMKQIINHKLDVLNSKNKA